LTLHGCFFYVTDQEEENRRQSFVCGDQPNDATRIEIADEVATGNDREEREIGVTLDYEPENPDGVIYNVEEILQQELSSGSREERHRNRRRRRRTTTEQTLARERERTGLCSFYSQHWLGQVLSGIFVGLVFFTIGIIFIAYFCELPDYVGILFILISLPAFCMAFNR